MFVLEHALLLQFWLFLFKNRSGPDIALIILEIKEL